MLARLARNTAAQLLSLLVSFVERFVVVGILLRGWGPQIYSEWAVLVSAASMLSLGELGLNIYYGNVLQKAWATADTERFQRTVAIALTCSIGVSIALGALSCVI